MWNDIWKEIADLDAMLVRLGKLPKFPSFNPQKITHIVHLDKTGAWRSVEALPTVDENNNPLPDHVYDLPVRRRTSGTYPQILWDKPDYVFGLSRPEKTGGPIPAQNPAKLLARYAAFYDHAKRYRDYINTIKGHATPVIDAIIAFGDSKAYTDPFLKVELDNNGVVKTSTVLFNVEGKSPFDDPNIVQYLGVDEPLPGNPPPVVGVCSITGRKTVLMDEMLGSLKNVPGGQSSGSSLISYNLSSVHFYGQGDEAVAPVSKDLGMILHRPLNYMLKNREHNIRRKTSIVLFWLDGSDPTLMEDFRNLDEADVALDFTARTKALRDTIVAPFRDDPSKPNVDRDGKFHAIILEGKMGRAALVHQEHAYERDMRQRIWDWREAQDMVGLDRYPSAWRYTDYILGDVKIDKVDFAKVGVKLDKLKDRIRSMIFDCAVFNKPLNPLVESTFLPAAQFTYQTVLAKARKVGKGYYADWYITVLASLAKIILLKNYGITMTSSLDLTNYDHAYLTGRLFAVYEYAKYSDDPEAVGSAVSSKFGKAMTSPRFAMNHLAKFNRHHMESLKRDGKFGSVVRIETLLEEIFQKMTDAFPVTHTKAEQSRFVIGYWHQKHEIWRKKTSATPDENTVVSDSTELDTAE